MLLTAGNRLSRKQLRRLDRVLATDDPTGEIGAAWGCKELLRQLLDQPRPDPDPSRDMAVIKQVERVGCGFVNMDNYRRRIMAHIAVTRPRLQAA
jgi:hypothetical protein